VIRLKTDVTVTVINNLVKLNWSAKADSSKLNSLSGIIAGNVWTGTGYSSMGNLANWNMIYNSAYVEKPDTTKKKEKKETAVTEKVMYPFNGYGWTETPKQEDLLIKIQLFGPMKKMVIRKHRCADKEREDSSIGKNLSAVLQE